MNIYDLEKFILEFGFVKKNDEFASLFKEYTYKDYFLSIYKLAGIKNKKAKQGSKYKIIFGKIREVDTMLKILPIKGNIGNMIPLNSKIKQTVTTTIKEIINYEEVIADSLIDIKESIKLELASEYRKIKIKKIIDNNAKH